MGNLCPRGGATWQEPGLVFLRLFWARIMFFVSQLTSSAPKSIFKVKLMLLFCHRRKCYLWKSLFVKLSCHVRGVDWSSQGSKNRSPRIVQHGGPESWLHPGIRSRSFRGHLQLRPNLMLLWGNIRESPQVGSSPSNLYFLNSGPDDLGNFHQLFVNDYDSKIIGIPWCFPRSYRNNCWFDSVV